MTSSHKLITIFTTLSTAIVCVLLVMIRISSSALADGPTRPDPDGPTRPNSNPSAQPSISSQDDDDDDDGEPLGAHIELQAQPVPAGVWTVVQWQDSSGGWHNVDGWQGTLDVAGRRRWWVAAKDFGTGPFRWLVTKGQKSASVLGTSSPFNLPVGANEIVLMTVSLNQ